MFYISYNNIYIYGMNRLMPGIVMSLMFYTSTYRYFADGPVFPTDISDGDNCRVNWWVDLLMVHNLVRTETMVRQLVCYHRYRYKVGLYIHIYVCYLRGFHFRSRRIPRIVQRLAV